MNNIYLKFQIKIKWKETKLNISKMPSQTGSTLLSLLVFFLLGGLIGSLLGLRGLLLAGRLVLGLHRQAGDEAADTSLVVTVFRILAGTDGLGELDTALEDEEQAKNAEASPLDEGLGAVAVPQVQSEPDGLLGGEVGVARQRPQAGDSESTLQILGGELILVLARDTGGVLVFVLGTVEMPLLLVGEELNDEEEEGDTREAQIGELEGLLGRELRKQEEIVGRGRKE